MERPGDTFSQNTSGYRMMIFRQLQQTVEAMQRPEEMLQWLASLIVQRFDVSIAQFWTCEGGRSNQPSAQLRAMASQDPSLPPYMFGEKVAATVEQIARSQQTAQTASALPVDRVFPRYLAMLLQRYGLSSCCYYVAEKTVRFAPTEYALSQRETALSLIALLFLRQQASQNLVATVGIILEQAIVLAENRRLLLPADSGLPSTPQEALVQESVPALPELVLRRKQDASIMLSSNPFSRTISIADKQAHRLYEAIDGRLTLNQLRGRTGMTLLEAQKALRELLRLQCIEVYTPEGQPVDVQALLNNLR